MTAPEDTVRRGVRGISLLELLIVITILGLIMAILLPRMVKLLEESKINRARGDIRVIEAAVMGYLHETRTLPDDLSVVGLDHMLDPWGRPYVYHPYKGPGWRGKARLDRFLVPLNSSFDLYSKGRDGESRPPLQNPRSWDDVVRANDGAYIGLASEF